MELYYNPFAYCSGESSRRPVSQSLLLRMFSKRISMLLPCGDPVRTGQALMEMSLEERCILIQSFNQIKNSVPYNPGESCEGTCRGLCKHISGGPQPSARCWGGGTYCRMPGGSNLMLNVGVDLGQDVRGPLPSVGPHGVWT